MKNTESVALNASVDPRDRARLSAKQEVVLATLKSGPRTNRQLNAICFSYRQRVSELRDAGYVIDCERGEDGLAVYMYRGLANPGQLELAVG